MTCDVLVVGAGPAGSTAARTCSTLGLRTILLEEHPDIGRPTHCTGKLSVHAFERFALPGSLIQSSLRAAALHAPDGSVARVRRAAVDSHVVDRERLDHYLAERAAAAGAEILVGVRARTVARLARDGGLMRVEANGRAKADGSVAADLRVEADRQVGADLRVEADGRVEVGRRSGRVSITTSLVIDAEGCSPVLPQQLGINPGRISVHGLQYEIEGAAIEDNDAPHLYFGRDVAPGFFAWLMPAGPGHGRLGLAVDPRATNRPPLHYLERLMVSHPHVAPRMCGARVVRKLAGRIPILGPRRPTVTDGMMVVGDAAGHVKATSGGGIYFSMLAGEMAGRAAAQYVGADARGRPRALAAYERGWRAAFGREIRFTSLVRRTLNRLPDRHLSTAIRALAADHGLRRALEEHGDTQYQSRILWPALAALARAGLRDRSLAPTAAAAVGACLLALWSPSGMPPAPEDRDPGREKPGESRADERAC